MDDAALTALHSQLSTSASSRGAHGGLGFSQPAGASKKSKEAKGTEATRILVDGKASSSREYHSTSAGAVAAGHWDPWARPVAFKMKEVNRRVGGLYSMFVKGGSVGGTLDAAPTPAAATAPTPAVAAVPTSAAAAKPSKSTKFNWKRAIKHHLRDAGGQLRLKRLRKAVLADWCRETGSSNSDKDKEENRKLFRRKLKKTSGVVLNGRHVRIGA